MGHLPFQIGFALGGLVEGLGSLMGPMSSGLEHLPRFADGGLVSHASARREP